MSFKNEHLTKRLKQRFLYRLASVNIEVVMDCRILDILTQFRYIYEQDVNCSDHYSSFGDVKFSSGIMYLKIYI